MADISKEIQDFEEAEYGEEVRGSMISLAEKVNAETEKGTANVATQVKIIQTTNTRVNEVAQAAENTIVRANQTLDDATARAEAAEGSAMLSKSWSVGGTNTRPGEDNDNSRYYSLQSKTEAQKALEAAARAEQYAGFVVPILKVNFATGNLDYPTTDNIFFAINRLTGKLDYALA